MTRQHDSNPNLQCRTGIAPPRHALEPWLHRIHWRPAFPLLREVRLPPLPRAAAAAKEAEPYGQNGGPAKARPCNRGGESRRSLEERGQVPGRDDVAGEKGNHCEPA